MGGDSEFISRLLLKKVRDQLNEKSGKRYALRGSKVYIDMFDDEDEVMIRKDV